MKRPPPVPSQELKDECIIDETISQIYTETQKDTEILQDPLIRWQELSKKIDKQE